MSNPPGVGWFLRVASSLVVHPSLWLVAVRQALRLAPRGWWHRAPYLPVPDEGYLRFRMVTQYGDPDRPPEPADLVSYLRWCRAEP